MPEEVGIEEFAYREAVRAITQQPAVLDNIRTRAGVMVSGATVATSFLAGLVELDEHHSIDGWVGIGVGVALYLAVVGLSLAILWPRKWRFSVSVEVLLGEEWSKLDDQRIREHLARYLDRYYDDNKRQLGGMMVLLQWSIVAVGLEVVGWLYAVAR